MTGNAINAKGEALDLHELSSEELDAVSGGSLISFLVGFVQQAQRQQGGDSGGFDPAQQFGQLLNQLVQ
jgi:hypothetical protein